MKKQELTFEEKRSIKMLARLIAETMYEEVVIPFYHNKKNSNDEKNSKKLLEQRQGGSCNRSFSDPILRRHSLHGNEVLFLDVDGKPMTYTKKFGISIEKPIL